ncbi:DoxX family protein [Thermithiobacillus tepidarius DSM 3134]|uniref:DoxX family protein n=1 Tax=Thermithiobacillus tepidarius TaxID=929 RepID=UPI0004295231|nr:DoxX family protein [Thermithiobacillus tepidarius]
MNAMKQYGPLLGRILLVLLFLLSGYNKVAGFSQTAGYMASKSLPMIEVLLVLSILVELGGALMILLGWRARWGALALFLWMIPVTFIFHNFWAVDPAQMQNQMNHFMKNLAIMGGLLYVTAYGSGPYSIDKNNPNDLRF